MIPLYRTNPEDETEHGTCPHCDTALSIPYISIIDDLQKLRALLDGSLNTTTCHGCGAPVTLQDPVCVNMEAHGIDGMFFVPFSYLKLRDFPAEDFAAPEEIGRIFYSLDELARQVRARIIVRRLRIEV